jgi:hypothetical protein
VTDNHWTKKILNQAFSGPSGFGGCPVLVVPNQYTECRTKPHQSKPHTSKLYRVDKTQHLNFTEWTKPHTSSFIEWTKPHNLKFFRVTFRKCIWHELHLNFCFFIWMIYYHLLINFLHFHICICNFGRVMSFSNGLTVWIFFVKCVKPFKPN